MKEIIYSTQRKNTIIYKNKYKGIKYIIINHGTHPTAYIKPKQHFYNRDDKQLENIYVHGGFTYYNVPYWEDNPDYSMWLGWDYAHCDDFICTIYNPHNKYHEREWTTKEILEDIHSVINQMEKKLNER